MLASTLMDIVYGSLRKKTVSELETTRREATLNCAKGKGNNV